MHTLYPAKVSTDDIEELHDGHRLNYCGQRLGVLPVQVDRDKITEVTEIAPCHVGFPNGTANTCVEFGSVNPELDLGLKESGDQMARVGNRESICAFSHRDGSAGAAGCIADCLDVLGGDL